MTQPRRLLTLRKQVRAWKACKPQPEPTATRKELVDVLRAMFAIETGRDVPPSLEFQHGLKPQKPVMGKDGLWRLQWRKGTPKVHYQQRAKPRRATPRPNNGQFYMLHTVASRPDFDSEVTARLAALPEGEVLGTGRTAFIALAAAARVTMKRWPALRMTDIKPTSALRLLVRAIKRNPAMTVDTDGRQFIVRREHAADRMRRAILLTQRSVEQRLHRRRRRAQASPSGP